MEHQAQYREYGQHSIENMATMWKTKRLNDHMHAECQMQKLAALFPTWLPKYEESDHYPPGRTLKDASLGNMTNPRGKTFKY